MLQSTLENFVNPKGTYNTSHHLAIHIGRRVSQWSWYNIKYRFRPPKFISVSLIPIDQEKKLTEEFDISMFHPKGFLFHSSLNHFIKLATSSEELYINAGYIGSLLAVNPALGYKELKRLLANETQTNHTCVTPGTTSSLQETRPGYEE